jgi:tetratricopeptide (TPR) repeat protein
MRRLLLPFFVLRLLLSLIPFLLVVLASVLYPIRSFLITLLFFLYFTLVLGKTLTVLSVAQPSNQITIEPFDNDTELKKWLSLYAQQPTHRDILINVSLLYSAQGDEENARKYLRKAWEVDPNNKIFQALKR